MSRYIEQVNETPKQTKDKPRTMPKPGTYTSEDLQGAKKIPTKDGYK